MLTGDTVVFEDEVNPAMTAAFDAGLEVTALHNQFFFDEPRVSFMHIGGHGDAKVLAAGVRKVYDKTGWLLCACDAGVLVAIDASSGRVLGDVSLSGTPDVAFGRLYVAVGDPGVVDAIDIGAMRRREVVPTEAGHTRWRSTGSATSSTHFYPGPIGRQYLKTFPRHARHLGRQAEPLAGPMRPMKRRN